ncbi:MAG: transglutaminase-like cysteine peptidase [Micavibrio sp.]|nr:transglutaminase-like cysteine peptidase [Micavibrio sp.]
MLSVKIEDQPAQPAHTGTRSPLQHSFIRSVSRQVRSHKLGDLLVASGIITEGQLANALISQKENGDRLGKVLLEQGSLSAVQLYRKLAEQWCIKASTAGVALMMQVLTPSVARADDSSGTVRLASAFSTATIRPQLPEGAHPGLFGTSEIKTAGVAMFPKWTAVMARFDEQMHTQGLSPTVQAWKTHLQGMHDLTPHEQIEQVNNYINSVRYVEDSVNYKKSDYWATPIEFLTRGGDCEDFAIAKYASLRALGFTTDQMRIAIVQDKVKNVPHAILIVYTDGNAYVLDNQDKRVRNSDEINRYKPIFSLNSNSWWLHKRA